MPPKKQAEEEKEIIEKPAAAAQPDKPVLEAKPEPDKPEVNLDERYNQILETNSQLQARVDELEKKGKSTQSAGTRGWDQVSEQDLQYIITHPAEYPDHATAAFGEFRKRERESIKSELSSELGAQSFKSRNPEAFDPNTPLGKEVSRILGANRAQDDVLSDVIELAQHRISGKKEGSKARKQLIDNLKDADIHAPGSDTINQPAAPSFMDMPKADFEKELQKVKLKTFS